MKTDIVILGAGLVGCGLAGELARYKVKVLVIERQPFLPFPPAFPGVLMEDRPLCSKNETPLLKSGYEIFLRLAEEFQWTLHREKGYFTVDSEDLGAKSPPPFLSPDLSLCQKDLVIFDPGIFALAVAEHSMENGVGFLLGQEVTGVSFDKKKTLVVHTPSEEISANLLINTSTRQGWMLEKKMGLEYRVPSLKGEILLALLSREKPSFDFLQLGKNPADHGVEIGFSPLYQQFFLRGKGEGKWKDGIFEPSVEGVKELVKKAEKCLLDFHNYDILHYWSHSVARGEEVIQMGFSSEPRYFRSFGGQRDLGLSLAIARDSAQQIIDHLHLSPQKKFLPPTPQPSLVHSDWEMLASRIAEDSRYGHLICPCQNVTEADVARLAQKELFGGELEPLIGATGATLGECQGQFCHAKLVNTLAYYSKKNGGS